MLGRLKLNKRSLILVLLLTTGVGSATLILSQRAPVNASDDKTIIRGGGTTIIHGGTGPAGGFVPVLTTIAFHAERTGGAVTGLHGDTATLTGTSNITGLGAGSNVPFTFVVQRGGPGATSVLTVNTLASPFNEILVQGAFEVHDQD